jgi:uncharacterized protein (DUF2252 family)
MMGLFIDATAGEQAAMIEPRLTVDERRAMGRALRSRASRGSHAGWVAPAVRDDPVALLEQQAVTRLQGLLPIRYGRMLESPFTFLRGSALVMARDLASTPVTGLTVQCCGDAHLSNFGLFASPERNLLFDINDFDETLPGPWEWDLKRLAASIEVAGRDNRFSADQRREAVTGMVTRYREVMQQLASLGHLEVWYARVSVDDVMPLITSSKTLRQSEKVINKARRRTSLASLDKLTGMIDGQRRIIEQPPVVVRVEVSGHEDEVYAAWMSYLDSLPEERRHLLGQYRLVDVAHKVVGVGSVGTRSFIILLEGRDSGDPLFLQFKEARPSVLEGPGRTSLYSNQGQRVVVGQRLMQASSDIFLGWMDSGVGIDFYWRQLRDMKGSADIASLRPADFAAYSRLCGRVLARAHARTGDRLQIAGYLGQSDRFAEAIADFAVAYADQTERDHAALVADVKQGRIKAEVGI